MALGEKKDKGEPWRKQTFVFLWNLKEKNVRINTSEWKKSSISMYGVCFFFFLLLL